MPSFNLDHLRASAHFVTESTSVEGVVRAVFTVEPPVVQNCVGPYGNAFHGVRPVFRLVSAEDGTEKFELDLDWLNAVLSSDETKLPSIARRPNHNLPFSHLAAVERKARTEILAEELRERSKLYPMVTHEESTARDGIVESYNWELSEMAWEFVYGSNEWWLTQAKNTLRRGQLTVKSVIGSRVELETGNAWVEVFESLPGADSLYWIALHISRFGTIYKNRPPPSVMFFQAGKILNRRRYQLNCGTNSTVHFPDMLSSSYFGYLINVETWRKTVPHTIRPLPWESLWDEPKSLEILKVTSSANMYLFDADELHSHRDEDRFLNTISPLTPEEFHWRARCLSPGAGCVWSPETDKYWPMLFRKIIRYGLQIRVAAGVSGVAHLPHEVVAIVGSFL